MNCPNCAGLSLASNSHGIWECSKCGSGWIGIKEEVNAR